MNLNKRIGISGTFHSILRKIVVILFFTLTIILFLYLNKVQPHYYIDEIFHIPQTLRFCDGKFSEWDQKITTFPGLYVTAIIFLAPFNLCSTIFLRSINLIGTFLNLYVVYEILRLLCINRRNKTRDKNYEIKEWTRLISSLNITLLPPLYFLLFLYYTDVLSTNAVLFMYLFYLKAKFKTSAFIGILAVFVRQTNIIWVAWLCIERGLDIVENKNPNRIHKIYKNTPAYIGLLWDNTREEIRKGRIKQFVSEIVFSLFPYMLIGLIFIIFVIWNKGIVLGDRSAHVATVHIPQIFYCSVFFCFFAWPYFITFLTDYLKLIKNHWVLVGFSFTLMAIIIHFNTLVHPYLLADNRHYTFYVWNKIIGRYYFMKYLCVPIYGYCLYSTWRCINHLRFLSQIGYFVVVFIVLIPQLLLEPRYFFIPYILLRINIQKIKLWQLFAELLMTLIVNIFQFYIFSTKVFYWEDDEYPQRISW